MKILLIDDCISCMYFFGKCTHSEGKPLPIDGFNIPEWCPLIDYSPEPSIGPRAKTLFRPGYKRFQDGEYLP